MRNEFEEDLKLQLKRQSAAHAAHLTDELETQSAIQIAEAEEKLTTELNNLTSDYVEQINSGRDHIPFPSARFNLFFYQNAT